MLKDYLRYHQIAILMLGILLVTLVSGMRSAPGNLPIQADLVIGPAISERPEPVPPPPTAEVPGPELAWRTVKVRTGDSLARIFSRERLTTHDFQALLHSKEITHRLRHIQPGEQFRYRTNDTGELLTLRYEPSRLEALVATRATPDEPFEIRNEVRHPERRLVTAAAEIDSSLFHASTAAGLDDATTMALADIFQWDIDFVLDIRQGDSFRVVLKELWLDGEKLGFDAILAAEFINRDKIFQAVRYTDQDGYTSYYTPNGTPLRKPFLRAPVQFSRISSHFNMRRLHPLHKTIRPHKGIDYAAPRGTPVVAAGDGLITLLKRNHYAAGNHLVIQHGTTYETRYLHLSRFHRGMKVGRRVHQGDVIGYVGATGWATGPHLHYEFLVHGIHKNPRTVDLPTPHPIDDAEQTRFLGGATSLIALLEAASDAEIALTPVGTTTGG